MIKVWCGINTITEDTLSSMIKTRPWNYGSVTLRTKIRGYKRWTIRKEVAIIFACTDEVDAEPLRYEKIYDVLLEGEADVEFDDNTNIDRAMRDFGVIPTTIRVVYAERTRDEYTTRRANLETAYYA